MWQTAGVMMILQTMVGLHSRRKTRRTPKQNGPSVYSPGDKRTETLEFQGRGIRERTS
jgi:hypothetical protein